jgi:hypothetical protein
MPKSSKKKVQAEPEIELHPDAWERFERFVTDVAKAGPKHRETAPKKSRSTKET